MKIIIKNSNVVFGNKPISMNVMNLFNNGYIKTPNNAKLKLLDNTINSLITAGIWDKIEHMFIPVLGTNNSDFMLDIKESYGRENQIMEFPENYIAKDDEHGGIRGTGEIISTSIWCGELIPTINVKSGDFHAACYVSSIGSATTPPSALSRIKLDTWNADCDFTLNSSANSLYPQSNSSVIPINFSYPIISSHKTGDNCVVESEYTREQAIVTGTSTDALRFNGNSYPLYFLLTDPWKGGGSGSSAESRGIKYYSTGKSLTNDEMISYSEIIKDFIDKLIV